MNSDQNMNIKLFSFIYYTGNYITPECINRFINSKGFDINAIDGYYGMPLLSLCITKIKNDEIIKILINHKGINLNFKDRCGHTPLMHAISKGKVEIAKILLKSDSLKINDINNNGLTALDVAIKELNSDLVNEIIDHKNFNTTYLFENANTINPITLAVISNSYNCLDILLDKFGPFINIYDACKCTPLLYAVRRNNITSIRKLLGCKTIDANATDGDNIEAIVHSISFLNYDAARLFIEHPNFNKNIKMPNRVNDPTDNFKNNTAYLNTINFITDFQN